MEKRTIFYLPIEPLNERYTEQWYRWFPKEFKDAGYNVVVIDGKPLTEKIETGEFLDINSTLSYKASQLEQIGRLFYTKQVREDDIFFIADLEFWGIESVRYLSVLNKIPIKIYGFMHAGSYDEEDFMAPCSVFAEHFEKGWLTVCDKIFVGSEFHRKLILDTRPCNSKWSDFIWNKIVVTGNPWNTEEANKLVGRYTKKKQIIHSNLPDYRKRPNIFLTMVPAIKAKMPDVEILLTTSRDEWGKESWIKDSAMALENLGLLRIKTHMSKREYYENLAESTVMFSATMQETFGYCIAEAMSFNTNPVIPNRLSCPELVNGDKNLVYDNYSEALKLVFERIESPIRVKHYAQKYDSSIKRIIEEMK